MPLELSDDHKRRIEQEESLKLAEERYRWEVRQRLISAPPDAGGRSSSSWTSTILGVLLGVVLITVVVARAC